jgi:serine/threonine protein kinase
VESLVGQRLGAYQLEAEIGRGSMGIVYRARHVQHGHPAAVKVLLESLTTDQSFVTRFTREARIVRALQHPNIVRLYDAGQEHTHIYFAMEYFAGTTAGQLLKQRGRLPVGQVVEIAAQAADALNYAHLEGHVVHRDIKPENLLVDRWCRVKVLDFGLARVDGLHSITRVGTVVGSLYYVSPEQLLGRQVDGRTDVYALGVSMYEMLAGQRPFRGRTLTEMTETIIAGKAAPLSQLEPEVPPQLEVIVLRAMARDLDRRYASAGELHADLRALQGASAPGLPLLPDSLPLEASLLPTQPHTTVGPRPLSPPIPSAIPPRPDDQGARPVPYRRTDQ